ncbi:MAG: prolipoprotein diacylglyceryl transferase [Verrucomicrobiota bacterium]
MTPLLADFLHNIDPFIFRVTENFGPRWYGLSYVLGFAATFLLLRLFIKRGVCELKLESLDLFITLMALIGVMAGGRLGYMLLYDQGAFLDNPLIFFQISKGGMASHGGIAGLCLFAFFYARYHKISWAGLGDNLVVCGPLGVFFGRLANFVNGELYGRPTDVSWAVRFPGELFQSPNQTAALSLGNQVDPEIGGSVERLIETARENPGLAEQLRPLLELRHPSQLYQAALEGLLLFLILLALRLGWKNAPHGFITGVFFILYALFRISMEQFREPDAELIMGVTRGQFYSGFMILVGAVFLVYSLTKGRKTVTGRTREP